MEDSGVPPLIEKSSRLLEAMYDDERALFAYSTRLDGGALVNDFANPAVHRYTINTLAGIQRALRHHAIGWDFDAALERFMARQLAATTNPGDRGLLLHVLAEAGHDAAGRLFEEIDAITRDRARMAALDIQEIAWMLIGLARYAAIQRSDRAIAAAERCFKFINRNFFDRDTLLPYFNASGFRRAFISFGGIVYFLKALNDYATATGDRYAATIFTEGVRQVIGLQGKLGEWPWFMNARAARVIDWYQIYTVHQDSMAMLFLLPALDRGVEEAREAIIKSYRWNFGANELGVSLVWDDPFFICRSIRRKGGMEREKRIARAVGMKIFGGEGYPASPGAVEVNTECRSYHIGWILYAWAGRTDFPELTDLGLLFRR